MTSGSLKKSAEESDKVLFLFRVNDPSRAKQSVLSEIFMQNDEQAIRQLVATWLGASKAGDTEKVLSLMADDVVFLMPGQPPMRGKAAFAAGQSGLQQFQIVSTSEIQEIKVFGE